MNRRSTSLFCVVLLCASAFAAPGDETFNGPRTSRRTRSSTPNCVVELAALNWSDLTTVANIPSSRALRNTRMTADLLVENLGTIATSRGKTLSADEATAILQGEVAQVGPSSRLPLYFQRSSQVTVATLDSLSTLIDMQAGLQQVLEASNMGKTEAKSEAWVPHETDDASTRRLVGAVNGLISETSTLPQHMKCFLSALGRLRSHAPDAVSLDKVRQFVGQTHIFLRLRDSL